MGSGQTFVDSMRVGVIGAGGGEVSSLEVVQIES